ncbi:polynucleotide kinase [Gordonia phage Mollymur]|uniref:Polynucleotide kinase n=1 Tax=Gordonia phage Mollymur TaxID=2590895 RepID=A0A4Y6EJI5_9CAUD|nr:ATPase [Gordonia phage Mollymur]QDF15474.1 polynucleotide kinase [Gordonia phage Mollymur]
MTTLTCMRGYPGSGKTTLARQESDLTGAVIVGRDFIREMLFGEGYVQTPDREDRVTIAQTAQVTALLKGGHDVIVDDCNVNSHYLKRFRDMARRAGADFEIVDVRTDVDTCVERATARALRGGRWVREEVIRKMAKRYPMDKWPAIKPRRPIVVEPLEPGENEPGVGDPVIIVDIDGTLAKMEGRSPYDYSRVSEDSLHDDVAHLVRTLSINNEIIIMSGRDDSCMPATLDWLEKHRIPFDQLLMRPAKSSGKDADPDWIVKLALFNEHIRGRFHVRFVLDDRDQVVELWRKLGLRCLQVAPGDF